MNIQYLPKSGIRMSRYQINYSRKAPDHRVPFDFDFVKKTNNPLDYFKFYKQGFNSSWLRYYQIHLSGVWILLLGGLSTYVLWSRSGDDMYRDKVDKYPTLHFIKQFQQGNTAPYDLVLNKFATDPFGNKDQVFEEY